MSGEPLESRENSRRDRGFQGEGTTGHRLKAGARALTVCDELDETKRPHHPVRPLHSRSLCPLFPAFKRSLPAPSSFFLLEDSSLRSALGFFFLASAAVGWRAPRALHRLSGQAQWPALRPAGSAVFTGPTGFTNAFGSAAASPGAAPSGAAGPVVFGELMISAPTPVPPETRSCNSCTQSCVRRATSAGVR